MFQQRLIDMNHPKAQEELNSSRRSLLFQGCAVTNTNGATSTNPISNIIVYNGFHGLQQSRAFNLYALSNTPHRHHHLSGRVLEVGHKEKEKAGQNDIGGI